MSNTTFILEKWQPESLNPGGPPGPRAYWQAVATYEVGSEIGAVLFARRRAEDVCKKSGAGFRVVRSESEVIYAVPPLK